jgi:DNA recombination-mediator protein A
VLDRGCRLERRRAGALRSGGLARLLAGEVGETSRDGAATRTRIVEELATLDERVEQMRAVVADAQDKVGARLVTALDRAEYPSNLRVIPSPPPFLFCRGELRRDDARSVAVVGTRQASRRGVIAAVPRLRFDTVAEWWASRFGRKVASGERRERTLELHRYHLDRHLMPELGPLLIRHITTADVAALLDRLREQGRSRRQSPAPSRRSKA